MSKTVLSCKSVLNRTSKMFSYFLNTFRISIVKLSFANSSSCAIFIFNAIYFHILRTKEWAHKTKIFWTYGNDVWYFSNSKTNFHQQNRYLIFFLLNFRRFFHRHNKKDQSVSLINNYNLNIQLNSSIFSKKHERKESSSTAK